MKFSKLIRRTHMYLALFLTPWLIIYALSGLVLNHAKLFLRPDGQLALPFEKVEEREYKAVFSADADARMIGAQVLEDLGLSGTFNTQGGPRRNEKAEIVRPDGTPIPRLYSAGELGSIYSYLYQGTGNLGECLAFGRIAGRNAAGLGAWVSG